MSTRELQLAVFFILRRRGWNSRTVCYKRALTVLCRVATAIGGDVVLSCIHTSTGGSLQGYDAALLVGLGDGFGIGSVFFSFLNLLPRGASEGAATYVGATVVELV